MHVPVIKKFEREKFMVFNIDNTWQIDLADVSNLKNKSFGQNYGFLFCAVDTLSRYAWVQPIKTKHASETRDALGKILKDTKRRPKIMYSRVMNLKVNSPNISNLVILYKSLQNQFIKRVLLKDLIGP